MADRYGTCLKCRKHKRLVASGLCADCKTFEPGHPCLAGCGRPGRRRSGFCWLCYDRIHERESRRLRVFRQEFGLVMPLPRLIHLLERQPSNTPEEREALLGVATMFRRIFANEIEIPRRRRRATA